MQATPLRARSGPVSVPEGQWLCGTVRGVDQETYLVALGEGLHRASRALGCLVTPEVGDEVCLLRSPSGILYLTQVLGRQVEKPLILEAKGGLSLQAAGPLSLYTAGRLSLSGEELQARFQRARWFVRLLEWTGVEVLLQTKVAKLFTRTAELLSGRLQVGAERSYRHISEAEHVRAGVVDVKAEHLVNIRGRNAMLSGRDLTKVDGAQIHVG